MHLHITTAFIAALALPLTAQVGSGPSAQGTASARTATAVIKLPPFIVGLQPGTDAVAFAKDFGVQVIGAIPFGATYQVEAIKGSTRMSDAALLTAIKQDPRTRYAEPTQALRSPEGQACMAPSSVSGLPCTISFYDGDPAPEKFYGQPLSPIIDLAGAQTQLTGAPSLVAVIDTGIDPTHSLFATSLFSPGYDFLLNQPGAIDVGDGLDNDLDGLVDEATGHGTHIAGTIILVNPDAMIMPLRVLDSDGNGNAFAVADAIYYAVSHGAQVINLSLGMSAPSQAVSEALDLAFLMNVEVYAAAGNTGKLGAQFPASYPTVLSVTAVDKYDLKAPFATFGPTINVAAPGVDIYSAMPGEAWAWWSGTSMATAVASGVGSLVSSVEGYSGDGPEEIVDSAVPIELLNPGLAGMLGTGRIDAGATIFGLVD